MSKPKILVTGATWRRFGGLWGRFSHGCQSSPLMDYWAAGVAASSWPGWRQDMGKVCPLSNLPESKSDAC